MYLQTIMTELSANLEPHKPFFKLSYITKLKIN